MAHAKIKWRDRWVCTCIKTSVEQMIEPRLRAECGWSANRRLRIFQGCYSTAVSASGNTHADGGALDTEKLNDTETRVIRECGVADWQRGTPQDTFFDDHSHGIWIGCPDLSPAARKQVVAYRNGKNGLANNGPDKSPHVAYTTWQDALKKYLPTKKDGILGMSSLDKFGNTTKQDFTGNGKWQSMKIDDKGTWSFLTGPKDLYVVQTGLTLSGLAVNQVCQLRYIAVSDFAAADKPTVTEYSYPIYELIGTEGSTFGNLSWMNDLGNSPKGSGAKLRLRLAINPPLNVKVSVSSMASRIAY